jgi:hypothetical protein
VAAPGFWTGTTHGSKLPVESLHSTASNRPSGDHPHGVANSPGGVNSVVSLDAAIEYVCTTSLLVAVSSEYPICFESEDHASA